MNFSLELKPGSRPIASAERDDIVCVISLALNMEEERDELSDDGEVAVSGGGAGGEVDGGVATGDGLGDVVVGRREAAVGPPREAAGGIAEGTEDVPRDREVGDGAGGEKLGGFGFEHSKSKRKIFGIVRNLTLKENWYYFRTLIWELFGSLDIIDLLTDMESIHD
ncbi:hypothetical protein Fmac_029792 [Flemingia macrophylla]|uniref:Uncharacterized protein n=1 Tax=Flemingia macrophylla TaxID=520843 RepID=A0ABD1LBY6_9FABA